MLVLVGDLDEATARRVLLKYIGGFRTQKSGSARKTLRYQPKAGSSTHQSEEGPKGVFVRLDTEYPLSGVNFILAGIGAELLRRHIVLALDGKDLSTEVTAGFHSYPQERLWMYVACEGEDAQEALAAVREGIRHAAESKVPAKDLAALKAMVQAETDRELSQPETMVEAVVARYGIGKDLVSHYKEIVNGVTAARLTDLLSSLAAGSTVSIVVE